ncbi:cysteine dioxygenase [Rhodanobacter sp. DHB23]|uniref:cysteine dioxygenase n=1 Tax=Rhodanobacter sp. DHB23 TaxID=2775923 RepID=UPI001782856E|nr:cysteine dioxygenase [Rhodanobacter sp. DHB23]MBD8873356.1 cysteine dioxygenase [Rhodanobacter sp. DHB23]
MHNLKTLREIALEYGRADYPDLAAMARDLGRVVHGDGPGLSARLAAVHRRGIDTRVLVECRQPALCVLVRAWPPGERMPLLDHAGGWGLELTLHGALEWQSYRRDPHSGELEAQGRNWLGPGDANWFERDAGRAHRCRNLSRHDIAYTLHVYGGELPGQRDGEPQAPARIVRARRQHLAGQLVP